MVTFEPPGWFGGNVRRIKKMVENFNALNKKVLSFAFVLGVLLALGSGSASAADYYVDTSNYSTVLGDILADNSDYNFHTFHFAPGVYNNVNLDITKPWTLVSDTGDYRTSGVFFTGNVVLDVRQHLVNIKGIVFENTTAAPRPVADNLGFSLSGVINIFANADPSMNQAGLSGVRVEKNKFVNITTGGGVASVPPYGISNTSDGSFYIDRPGGTLYRHTGVNKYLVNLSVVDNYFSNLNSSGNEISSSAIDFSTRVKDSVIRDNFINGTSQLGIYVRSARNSDIINNTINFTGDSGILIREGSSIEVRDNVVQNADFIYDEDDYFRAAIAVRMGSKDVEIVNNVLTENRYGVVIQDIYPLLQPTPNEAVLRGNDIHSNTGEFDLISLQAFTSAINASSLFSAVRCSNSTHCTIAGRLVHSPPVNASLNYWGSNAPNVSRIVGNVIYLPFYQDTAGTTLIRDFSSDVLNGLSSGEAYVFNVSSDEEAGGEGVVRNVTVNLNGTADDVRLVVSVMGTDAPLATRSGSLPRRTAVYRYLEITLNESVTDNSTVIFSVPTSWLRSNRVDKNNVVLMRFSSNSWESLETTVVRETRDEVTFSAVTPGFSFFAVGGTVTPSRSSSGSRSRSSSGGSGGGGSSYIPAPDTFPWLFVDRQAVNVVQRLNPGEPFEFNTSGRGVVVTSVTIGVNTAVNNGVLIAASLRSRPSSISDDPEGTLYRYVGVGTDNVNAAYVDGITTTFAVSKEWMESNNAGNENVVLFAYDKTSSSWVNVGARMVSETDSEVLFESETKGSEIFAIVSQGEGAAVPETEPVEPESAAQPEAEPEAETYEEPLPAEPETLAPEDETTESGGSFPILPITIFIALAAIIGFVVYKKRK